jgi:hypothetical protein
LENTGFGELILGPEPTYRYAQNLDQKGLNSQH